MMNIHRYIDSFWTQGKPICPDLRSLRLSLFYGYKLVFSLASKTEKYLLILPDLIQSSFKGDDRLGSDDLLWQTVPGLFKSVCEVVLA